MPRNSANVIVVLLLLSLLAVFALHVVGLQNGMIGKIVQNVYSSRPTLPGSNDSLWTTWTGIQLLDLDFSIMITVFVAVLDTDNISLFIQANHFFGLWMSIWISILLESYRQGRQGAFKKYVYWGLVMEFAGVAVGAPTWFATHLGSVVFSSSHRKSQAGETSIPWVDLRLLPWSYLIGLIIPTIGMIATGQATSNRLYSSQTWILIRLFHPAFTFIVHQLLREGAAPAKDKKDTFDNAAYRTTRLNQIYTIAFWLSAAPHILVLSAAAFVYLFSSYIPAHLAQSISVASLWPVSSIWGGISTTTETIQTGVATFLTANELIPSAAFVIWAWGLNRESLRQYRPNKHMQLSLFKMVFIGLVFGPGATAITLLENRERILERASKHNDGAKQS